MIERESLSKQNNKVHVRPNRTNRTGPIVPTSGSTVHDLVQKKRLWGVHVVEMEVPYTQGSDETAYTQG
jgi:hypothetical protein